MAIETFIVRPPEGWEESTYYVVDVKLTRTNVAHRAIFFSGFLNGPHEGPGSYASLWNATYEGPVDFTRARPFFMKVIRKIGPLGKAEGGI